MLALIELNRHVDEGHTTRQDREQSLRAVRLCGSNLETLLSRVQGVY